ncbi:MAG: 4-hydroxy-tetrahydrodipicolinate reductase [Sphingomicrobium sp.]
MRTSDQPIRLSLIAPDGRMGKAIAMVVAEDSGFAIDQDHGDVLVDFSVPGALGSSLDQAIAAGVPILVGTTGLDQAATGRIAEASRQIAVLRAANTSLGIAVLSELVREAASLLGDEWDIEIVETHHALKADAPSGTALLLGHSAAAGRGVEIEAEIGRSGTGLERSQGAIGFASLRGGTVAGEHEVKFLGPKEQVTLSHRAENRLIFAKGALAGARFLIGKPAGLYSMQDVIRQP